MILKKAIVKNYRLLEDIEIDLDEKTTIVVGKNNTGKTSFSNLFNVFLGDRKLSLDDFSINCQKQFIGMLAIYNKWIDADDDAKISLLDSLNEKVPIVSLRLSIEYGNTEGEYTAAKPFATGLVEDNAISLLFEYRPIVTTRFLSKLKDLEPINTEERFARLRELVDDEYDKMIFTIGNGEIRKVFLSEVKKIIRTEFIDAQRNLDDGNNRLSSKLSSLLANYYNRQSQNADVHTKDMKALLSEADVK
ncbi:MAG: AAA family ATPase, partial [Candidatus Izemoplasmatales bacterium]|nr:AAA family ATPase [Candidatus Izemoplasmatales bacterium]